MPTTARVNELVERMLKSSGGRVDISSPVVDAMLPEGHRLHVDLDGISRGLSEVDIRDRRVHGHYAPRATEEVAAITSRR
jgi:pilus assembly protein CpaF